MRGFHVKVFCSVLICCIACNKIDAPASLHKIVTDVPGHVASEPVRFALDSLLLLNRQTLMEKFGAANVVPMTAIFASNSSTCTVKLLPKSENELEIMLSDSTRTGKVLSVVVRKNSHWSTATGLHTGMTLKELEILNDTSFMFYSGGWDGGGLITNWNHGKLEKANIKLCRLDRAFLMPYDMSKGDYHIHEFVSSADEAQRGNPTVEEIIISQN